MNAGPWLVLAITLAIQSMVSMALLTLPAMAPAVATELGVSPTLTGAYVGTAYVGAMLASLLTGQLVTRYGAIRVSQAGLMACAAGLSLSLVPSLWAVAGGAFLIGLGYGPITPASSHLLALTTPRHRAALIFSIKQTGVPLGGMLAGAIVPSIVQHGNTRMALAVVAAANVACLVLAQPLRRALDADRQPASPVSLRGWAGPLRMVLSDPGLVRLAALSFVFSAVQLCLTSYLVTYLNAGLGYTLIAAGLALSVAQAGGVGGRVLWGYVSDRWLAPRRMLAVLAALMTAGAAATAALQPTTALGLALPLLALFGASAIGWNGVYLSEVARLAPHGMASVATGGTLAVTFLGVVVGPMLFGAISAAFDSYRAGYLALAVPTAACCWWLVARAGRAEAEPA